MLWTYVPLWPAYLVFAIPFLYFASEPFITAVNQILALPLLAILVSGSAATEDDKFSIWFFRFCVGWLVVVGISSITSEDPTSSIPVFLKVIGMMAIVATVRYLPDSAKTATCLFWAAALAGLLHGWISIREFWDAPPMPATWVDPAMKGLIRTRCAGIFSDPNIFGAYLAGIIPLIIAGIFSVPSTPRSAVVFGGGLIGAGVGLLMTFSRGAYLAGFAGAAALLVLKRPGWKETMRNRVLLISGGVVLAIFLLGPFKYRLTSVANPADMTVSQRSYINQAIIKAIPQIPLFGFGLHTFNQVYPRFRLVGGDYPMNAHNEILHSFLETGAIGVFFLLGICVLIFLRIFRFFRDPGGEVSWITSAGCASFLVFFLHNLSGFSDRIYPTAVLIAIMAGLVFHRRTEPESPGTVVTPGLFLKIFGCVFFAIYLVLNFKNLHIQLSLEKNSHYLREGNISFAEASLRNIESVDENIPLVHMRFAQIDEAAGRLASAQARLSRAAELNPTEAWYWYEQSRIATKAGLPGKFEFMEKAVGLDPAAEFFRYEYAKLLASDGRSFDAVTQLDEALKRSPGYHDVYAKYKDVESLKMRLLGGEK